MKVFRKIILGSWIFFVIFLIAIFTIPKAVIKIMGPASIELLFLWVVIGTGIYKALSMFRVGMKRP